MQHAVGTTGTAAQTVVVEFDHIGERRERAAHGTVGALYMAEVARVLHGNDASRPLSRTEGVDAWYEPLVNVADARAEFVCPCGVLRIMLKQMSVRNQHRAATTGIGDDGRVLMFESLYVLAGQCACAFKVACVRMQRTAANLCVRRLNFASVNFQHSGRRFVDTFEEAFRHATSEEQNWSAGSARILRAVRRLPACQ